MIYLVIPSVTPRLAACALEAIERTTPEPHRVIVVRGPDHGESLDRALGSLPDNAQWMMTLDDDAAPLRVGWLTWLLARARSTGIAGFFRSGRNYPIPAGCLYSVPLLRAWGASFSKRDGLDVGEGIRQGVTFAGAASKTSGKAGVSIRTSFFCAHRPSRIPWWLRTCDVAADDEGCLIFAHLGGGTIGHTWLHKGRLYPRIPTWLWPYMVRRHLDSVGAPRARDRGRDVGGRVPVVIDRTPRTRDGARFLDSQHPHGAGEPLEAGSVAQMERARQLQAWEER